MPTYDLSPFPGGENLLDYATRFRRDDVEGLEVGPALDLFPEEPPAPSFTAKKTWTDTWPHAKRAGVYLIYGADFDLLYVGKAWIFKERLTQHFGSDNNACRLREHWFRRPRYVINVAVPSDMAFEAAALEVFLIHSLKPPLNTQGKYTWD